MQDRIIDSRRRITIFLTLTTFILAACAAAETRGYVDASAWSANYTEDYIHAFHLETASGENLLLSGGQVKQFSKGGTGASECCSMIPGVGQTIRVVWQIGGYNDDEAQWKTYSSDVVVTGTMPQADYKLQSYLVVRFFPKREIEAELLPGDGSLGPQNPRMDRLFFVGPRIMRHKGD